MKNLSIGDRVKLDAIDINAKGGVEIGNDCLIAGGTKIWSINHCFRDPTIRISEQGYDEGRVTISEDVWIGSNAIILPGITIGRGAVVAAGAVVTKDIAPFMVVAGVPAKPIGRREGLAIDKSGKLKGNRTDIDDFQLFANARP
jgi:acetyltransferase-like isoleucine patch superfamily enzyme